MSLKVTIVSQIYVRELVNELLRIHSREVNIFYSLLNDLENDHNSSIVTFTQVDDNVS